MTPPEHSIHDYLRRLPLLSDEQAWLLSDRQSKQTLFQQITTMPTEPMTTSAPAQRRVPRRPLAMASTLVAALALAMLALASGMIPNTAPAAYAVREMPNGMLEVEWNGELDGERLAATLRNYDIDVRVETEPASPSLVGTVVGLGPLEDQGDAVFEWGETSSTFTLDPSAFKGTFQILVERPAQPGEAYAAAASVFAEGEVLGGLQCAIDGRPVRADDVAGHLERLGQKAVWDVFGEGAYTAGVPEGIVLSGHARDPQTVDLTVRLDGDNRTPADPDPLLEGRDCTPEMAARWH